MKSFVCKFSVSLNAGTDRAIWSEVKIGGSHVGRDLVFSLGTPSLAVISTYY